MAENKKISDSVFIQSNDNYNHYNDIDDDSVNKALKFDENGNVQFRENDFDKKVTYTINSKNVLQFREDENRGFLKRTGTDFGDVTENGSFIYNNGNNKNIPQESTDKDDSSKRIGNISMAGNLNVNTLRSLNNKEQKA